jgi:hypothetical protein
VNVFPSLDCWIGVTLVRSEKVLGLYVLTQCNKFILDVSEEYAALVIRVTRSGILKIF